MALEKEHLIELKEWLSGDVVSEEELFDETFTIIELIEYWLDTN